jgi:PKD repeat protein
MTSRPLLGSLCRAVTATLAIVAVLACVPAAASASGGPIARWTCSAPGLVCDPCPVHCSSPTGRVAAGVAVSFDGRPSSDDRPPPPAGTVVGWEWNFGDGTTASGPLASHAFASANTYSVTLVVTDDQGKTDTKALQIVVAPTAIAATASPDVVLGSGALTDGATVTGRTGQSSSDTIDFRLYGPDDALCAGAPVFESGDVPYPVAGGNVTSAAFTPTVAGTYRWIASYGGDANNPPVASRCSDAADSVLVSAPPPPPPAPVVVAPPPPPPVVLPTCFGKKATIVATAGQRVIVGTAHSDVIVGTDAAETIDGEGGNDTICGRGGNDTIRGGPGNDRIYGDDGRDLLLGGTGADQLYGGSGNDRLGGGDGADRVDGGSGNDMLDDERLGGAGKDRLIGGTGADLVRAADHTNDSIDCGAGHDIARLDPHDRQTHCEHVRRVR